MIRISLTDVTAQISSQLLLNNINLEMKKEECWAIVGANGAGKSSLGKLICDDLQVISGKVEFPVHSEYVSFEKVIEILDIENENDESDYMGGGGYIGTTAEQFICDTEAVDRDQFQHLASELNFNDILPQELRSLSTGEMRKVVICRALLHAPKVLVLDEPFDGLDSDSCITLKNIISSCVKSGITIVLLLNRFSEILPEVTHVAYLKDCSVFTSGPKKTILQSEALLRFHSFHYTLPAQLPTYESDDHSVSDKTRPLIEMKNVTVRYGEKTVLHQLDWAVLPGQNWTIAGPNGSGKTTLLHLISGDNVKAYGNDIQLFGRKKGSGESVWEIKERLGFVSSSFQQRYRVGISAKAVIISGFFDSIGIYRKFSKQQENIALQWLSILGIETQKNTSFHRLSYGEQRLLLIARAMVKQPMILILDEPCQGLDDANREMVLKLIDHLGQSDKTQLLYVSHRTEDKISCIDNILQLVPAEGGGSTAVTLPATTRGVARLETK